ncbi:uncharacterized protein LOC111636678 isoform X2 [Centruroides sculpturatus]|uniref:uncharacterized protein LOC111636678 isoform X1 n=1 Tax=Centruroides sculpturatus TaxID=218467 RepID=UPI000C6CD4E8|nr:uncharacterized protein LOC111636678 isoform X1 [Centruroides sculpturatus]XP_023237740.1 uncharacterized protein LOC111636678 isoform X2 [Centruroides sculpturatus]
MTLLGSLLHMSCVLTVLYLIVGSNYGKLVYNGKLEKLNNKHDGATTTNLPHDYSYESKLDKIRKEAKKKWRNIRDYFFKNDSMNTEVEESMPFPYTMSLTNEDTNEVKQNRDILVEILLSVYDSMNLMSRLLEGLFN